MVVFSFSDDDGGNPQTGNPFITVDPTSTSELDDTVLEYFH